MCKRYRPQFLILILTSLILLFNNCGNKSENTKSDKSNELSELSIYNLPSQWENHKAQTVSLEDYKGKITVFVMVYTSCQSACPRLTSDMKAIDKKIPEANKDNLNLVFVSIDPEVDSPDKMQEFFSTYQIEGNHWQFIRGSLDDTREFSMVLGVKYQKVSPIDFSHSNIISVFNENGVLAYQQSGLGVDNDRVVKEIIERTNRL